MSASEALLQLTEFDSLIDVRSEAEFALDHLPGAINCPVLTDAERVEVGTMDRQQSSFEARRRGAAYVARNIAHHIERHFHSKPKNWRPLVYCWRGGNRSAAMTHTWVRSWQARQLQGGSRAYEGNRRGSGHDPALYSCAFCAALPAAAKPLLQELRTRAHKC